MWSSSSILLLPLFFALSFASCSIGPLSDPVGKARASDVDNFHEDCVTAIRTQVRKEFEASLQYLLMGAYFAQDDVNLEGLSKMFFEHADEEREHGTRFIEYLRMRGDTSMDFFGSSQDSSSSFSAILPILGKMSWLDAEEALRDALAMEKIVTGSIKKLIDVCDDDKSAGLSDYHAADWLTGQWLDEQLEGQRKLAGMVNSLNTFRRDHEPLADWMFSNNLLMNA